MPEIQGRNPVRNWCIIVVGSIALSLAFLMAASALATEKPYEPNDSIAAASGPLVASQPYVAALEIPDEKDFFYFYVTSRETSEVSVTVRNEGGGTETSDLDTTILDSSATPVAAMNFIRKGEQSSTTIGLGPEKYFVEVTSNEGFGDTFSLTASGAAVGPYSQIASRCAAASASATHLQAGLSRAKGRLQRMTGRLRRARYDGQEARRKARTAFRRAKARVASRRDELEETTQEQRLWCGIPQ